MLDFDIIFCMDWIRKSYVTIDPRNVIVRFQFSNESELEQEGLSSNQTGKLVSHL